MTFSDDDDNEDDDQLRGHCAVTARPRAQVIHSNTSTIGVWLEENLDPETQIPEHYTLTCHRP